MKLDVAPSLFAPLRTIRLHDLCRGFPEEKEKLYAAATEDGIFYLDFSEEQNEFDLANLTEGIYSLSRSLFDLDLEEKLQYDVDKIGELKLNGFVLLFSLYYLCQYRLIRTTDTNLSAASLEASKASAMDLKVMLSV